MNLPLLPFRMVILIVTAIIGAFVGGIISALRLLIKCSFDGKITKKEQEQVEKITWAAKRKSMGAIPMITVCSDCGDGCTCK